MRVYISSMLYFHGGGGGFFSQTHSLSPSFRAPSLRLAYKDFEQHRKNEEQKLKALDGKKKEQAERLGMGLGARRYDEERENLGLNSHRN